MEDGKVKGAAVVRFDGDRERHMTVWEVSSSSRWTQPDNALHSSDSPSAGAPMWGCQCAINFPSGHPSPGRVTVLHEWQLVSADCAQSLSPNA